MPVYMASSVNIVQRFTQKGISRKNFRRTTVVLVIAVIAFFIISYLIGYNFLKPFLQPLSFALNPPTYIYSIYGQGLDGQLNKPMGVTVANSKIYVTDTSNNRVQIFDYNGRPIGTFGKAGNAAGDFQFPYGIAADSNNNIYVADMWANNIQVFSPDGKFIRYFARDKQGKSTVGKPTGLAIRNGKLYEADLESNSIKVFDLATDKKVLEFGTAGKGPGQLVAPNSVAVTSNKVYVGDSQNDRIEAFSTSGKFLYTMDGSDNGQNPKTITVRGVGVDGRGVVYGASLLGNYICGFDSKGKYLWTFGSQGLDDGQFYLPNGLFVDNQGRIYITDQTNNRVSVWEN